MTTVAGCSICDQSLTKKVNGRGQGSSGVNAVVAACHHVFHSYCLNRWTGKEPGQHGTCPVCSKCIKDKHCFDLYLNEIVTSELPLDSLATIIRELEEINQQRSAAEEALKAVQLVNVDLSDNLDRARKEIVNYEQRFHSVKFRYEDGLRHAQVQTAAAVQRAAVAQKSAIEAENRANQAEAKLQTFQVSSKFETAELAKIAENRVREASERAAALEHRAKGAKTRIAALESQVQDAETHEKIADCRLSTMYTRVRIAEVLVESAQKRIRNLEAALGSAEQRAREAEASTVILKQRIAALEVEKHFAVDRARVVEDDLANSAGLLQEAFETRKTAEALTAAIFQDSAQSLVKMAKNVCAMLYLKEKVGVTAGEAKGNQEERKQKVNNVIHSVLVLCGKIVAGADAENEEISASDKTSFVEASSVEEAIINEEANNENDEEAGEVAEAMKPNGKSLKRSDSDAENPVACCDSKKSKVACEWANQPI